MVKEESTLGSSASVGTNECPATVLRSRISIVRASEHRSIDISVETTAFQLRWPEAQLAYSDIQSVTNHKPLWK
jgi:hypothetical protein